MLHARDAPADDGCFDCDAGRVVLPASLDVAAGERQLISPAVVLTQHFDYKARRRFSGAVEFRLHAVSRASGEGAPWTRLGFRIFGRREQVRFYLRCCERIARLTARELGLPGDPRPPAVRLTEEDPARTREPASDPLPGG